MGLASLALLVAACAGGRGPAAQGPALELLQRQFTRAWTLDEDASDPTDETRMGASARERVRSDVPREVAAGSTTTTAARTPGGGAPGTTSIDVRAMDFTLEMGALRPATLTTGLDATSFRVRYLFDWTVPANGDDLVREMEGHEVRARVEWDGDIPTLERRVERGGRILDRFEVQGERLHLIRRIDMSVGSRRDVREFRLVYVP